VRTLPDPYATGSFSAANAFSEALGEEHGILSLVPRAAPGVPSCRHV
jgi:hypothetical protein